MSSDCPIHTSSVKPVEKKRKGSKSFPTKPNCTVRGNHFFLFFIKRLVWRANPGQLAENSSFKNITILGMAYCTVMALEVVEKVVVPPTGFEQS